MKTGSKYVFLFLFGAFAYCEIEILFRGYTHWSMGILGGICFILCGLINEKFQPPPPLWIQMGICTLIITALEFLTGVILNLGLQLNIWDYSHLPFNLFGQICLPFAIIWYFLSLPAIVVDDLLRHFLFGEEMPKYNFFRK